VAPAEIDKFAVLQRRINLSLTREAELRAADARGGRSGGGVLDFWVDQGGATKFGALSSEDSESESLPRTVHGVTLRCLRRPDMIAFAMRIQNWAQIVPCRISFLRHSDCRLQNDILARLEKPHRLDAEFHPVDISVRALSDQFASPVMRSNIVNRAASL